MGANMRVVTNPLQNCKSGEIKIQFEANRIGELDPIGRIRLNGSDGDLYAFHQVITNTARLNTTAASGNTPTNLELSPVTVLLRAGSPASNQLNQSWSDEIPIPQVELIEMGVPGYGIGATYPILRVILREVTVDHIRKMYGDTEREQIHLAFDSIAWELQWFYVNGGPSPTYDCEYDVKRNRVVSCDDFGGPVTAYIETPSPLPEWPEEFLIDYFEQNFSSEGSIYPIENATSDVSFSVQKDIDPATIANLGALLSGLILPEFNVQMSTSSIEQGKTSPGSVEISFKSKASVMEKVLYRVAPD